VDNKKYSSSVVVRFLMVMRDGGVGRKGKRRGEYDWESKVREQWRREEEKKKEVRKVSLPNSIVVVSFLSAI